ncbi:MAG: hypothetical protein EBU20_13640, partial [Betaproteobacteria bacterium]|nr:hypothetical protein [Betaproteobacteria bacterium]
MVCRCAADHCFDKSQGLQVGFAIIKRIEWPLAHLKYLLRPLTDCQHDPRFQSQPSFDQPVSWRGLRLQNC